MEIEMVIKAIKKEPELITVKTLAKDFGYSEAYFSRVFKQAVGISPSEYIQAVRRERAIEEIVSRDDSILSSQLKSGYLSEGSFSNFIKRAMSIPPKKLKDTKDSVLKEYNDVTSDYEAVEESQEVDLALTLDATESFDGIVFVGLFTKPVPDRPPVIGIPVIKYTPGVKVNFRNIPDGSYYVLACVIHKTLDPRKLFVLKDNLRGMIHEPFKFPGKYEHKLLLRPPEISDPPITLNLPKLLIETIQNKKTEHRSD